MTATARRSELSVDAFVEGILRGDRAVLARAITRVESSNPAHQLAAREVTCRLMPYAGRAVRVGITGVPGAGKSTLIGALGRRLVDAGHRLAVLAVDPSSEATGGSILGDKTRMPQLCECETAFIRPSPSGGTLGGVAGKTREALLLCEAAGFDVVFVETVGVGQSETAVAEMTDFMLVLALPGAGDELQGIKRGVLELADAVAVNKADGDNLTRAQRAASEYDGALAVLRPVNAEWKPRVLLCSASVGTGLGEIWDAILAHRRALSDTGRLAARRREQMLRWMWSTVDDHLRVAVRRHLGVRDELPILESDVLSGRLLPSLAAARVLKAFGVDATG